MFREITRQARLLLPIIMKVFEFRFLAFLTIPKDRNFNYLVFYTILGVSCDE